ncbi:MAG TPA: exopolysaccharide biosynthesis polyprenyl glycosylphosphotransferase [Solirubrobacterales bacterium]|nr:exopolysaccharide biosynthesis polyprenyl glycosylphosphotransferase [Solirubrobacterales bacterium]
MAKSSSSIDTGAISDVTASRVPVRRWPVDLVGLRGRRRAHSGPPIFDATSFGVDAAMLALAAVASVLSAPAASLRTDVISLTVFCVLVLVVLVYFGLYRFSFATHFLEDARAIVAATAIVAMCMTFGRVLIFDNPDAAAQAARAWLFASTYVIAARGGRHIVEMRRRREGVIGERALIIGAGAVGRQFADRLLQRPEFGLRPVAFVDDDPLEFDDRSAPTVPVLGSQPVERGGTRLFGPGLEAALEELQVTHVVVSFSTSSHQAELDLLRRCQARGVTVSVLPRLFEGVTDDLELERIGGIPIVSVRPSDPQGWQYAIKYGSDRVIAALAIAVTSPVMLLAALATLLTLGRPILFRQARVGLDGKEFDVLKFRTMRDAAPDEGSAPEPAASEGEDVAPGGVEGVDRRTRTGTLLRRSSIDELPQLFNVFRGDMSLVGPRPERPSYVRLFDESVYRYADRHRVKSGITGWSQVQGLRGNTSIADRVEWDNYYIENRSPWLDFKIILMTGPALLRDFGKPRS